MNDHCRLEQEQSKTARRSHRIFSDEHAGRYSNKGNPFEGYGFKIGRIPWITSGDAAELFPELY